MTDQVDAYNQNLLAQGEKLLWKPAVKTKSDLPEQPKDKTACFVESENTLFVFDGVAARWDAIPLEEENEL